MYSQLDFLADTIIIEAMAKDAQDNSAIASIANNIKEYVISKFDKERPVASVIAFIGPGILWSLGFKWISVLYEVAEALGFDWVGFWEKVKNGIETFLSTIVSNEKPSEQTLSSHINDVISSAMQNSFTGNTDENKLQELAESQIKSFSINEVLELKKFALSNSKPLLKNAGFINIFKGKIIRFFIKTIGWIITVALISLGFAATGGAISGLLNIHKNTTDETNVISNDTIQPVQQLTMSNSASSDLYVFHNNDLAHIWLIDGELSNIKDIILDWIISTFPELKNSDIQNSTSLSNMIALFYTRNKMSYGTGLITVPKPYERKIDIISQIVNNYMKEHPEQIKQPQSGQNIAYK